MQTFSEWAQVRSRFASDCDALREVWDLYLTSQADFDKLAERSVDHVDPVSSLLDDAVHRMDTSVIEVGFFGLIKRGKSTLVNAVLGTEVTSMGVTPETAVPVWIERGHGHAQVIYADGVVEDRPIREAMAMATQRFAKQGGSEGREDDRKAAIVRIAVYVDVPWLPNGVRLIDTPGLADPSMSDVYRQFTLAEFERVSAAVIVFGSQPPITPDELELIRSLQEKRVDKAFLVCNFRRDHWESAVDREAVLDYITEAVTEGATDDGSGQLSHDAVRLYSVNAKLGLLARKEGDNEAFEHSGCEEVARAVETYVAGGAFDRLTFVVRGRLIDAAGVLQRMLERRRDLVRDPAAFDGERSRRERAVAESRRSLDRVILDVKGERQSLVEGLTRHVDEIFVDTIAELAVTTRERELEMFEARLRIRLEIAASRIDEEFSRRLGELDQHVRNELYDTFAYEGPAADLGDGASVATRHADLMGLSYRNRMSSRDWSSIATTGGIVGVSTGIVAGSLAGGVGIALIALGPVGWLIGAGIGLAVGGLSGSLAAGAWTKGRLSDDAKSQVKAQILVLQSRMSREVERSVDDSLSSLCRQLGGLHESFARNEIAELHEFERYAADSSWRIARLEATQTLLLKVRSVREDLEQSR